MQQTAIDSAFIYLFIVISPNRTPETGYRIPFSKSFGTNEDKHQACGANRIIC